MNRTTRVRAEQEQNERIRARTAKSKKDREGREDEAERREMKDQTIEEQNKCSRQQGALELGDKVTG